VQPLIEISPCWCTAETKGGGECDGGPLGISEGHIWPRGLLETRPWLGPLPSAFPTGGKSAIWMSDEQLISHRLSLGRALLIKDHFANRFPKALLDPGGIGCPGRCTKYTSGHWGLTKQRPQITIAYGVFREQGHFGAVPRVRHRGTCAALLCSARFPSASAMSRSAAISLEHNR
jgi:hypothetical protein